MPSTVKIKSVQERVATHLEKDKTKIFSDAGLISYFTAYLHLSSLNSSHDVTLVIGVSRWFGPKAGGASHVTTKVSFVVPSWLVGQFQCSL